MAARVPDEFALLAAAMELYRREEISASAAADMAGISKAEFLRRRAEFGVLAFPEMTKEELAREEAAALRASEH